MSTNGDAEAERTDPDLKDPKERSDPDAKRKERPARRWRAGREPGYLPNRQTVVISAGLLAVGVLVAVLGLTVFADDADQPGSLSTGYAVAVLAAIAGGAGLVFVARERQAYFGRVRRTVSELEDRADEWIATGTPVSTEPIELELRAKRMRNHLLDSGDIAQAQQLTAAIRAMRDVRIGRDSVTTRDWSAR